MAAQAIEYISQKASSPSALALRLNSALFLSIFFSPDAFATNSSAVIGEIAGEMVTTPLERVCGMVDVTRRRPIEQWWLALCETFHLLAKPDS